MNGAIIYVSKYGATRQYSEWLSESLNMDLYTIGEVTQEKIIPYHFVLFASPVYAGKLLIGKPVQKHWYLFNEKKRYLLMVGLTAPERHEEIEKIAEMNFTQEQLGSLKWFFVRGRLDNQNLRLIDKLLIKAVASTIKDPKEKDMLKNGFDDVKKENLNRIIEVINQDNS